MRWDRWHSLLASIPKIFCVISGDHGTVGEAVGLKFEGIVAQEWPTRREPTSAIERRTRTTLSGRFWGASRDPGVGGWASASSGIGIAERGSSSSVI